MRRADMTNCSRPLGIPEDAFGRPSRYDGKKEKRRAATPQISGFDDTFAVDASNPRVEVEIEEIDETE